MAILKRRTPAPVRKSYRSYKRFLRIDFNYRCVFCGIHENDHGGFWHFHVEHYRPKVKFKALKTDYTNLLYGCDKCNTRKGTLWPSDDPIKDGKGWLDPCTVDLDKHYQLLYAGGKLSLHTHSVPGQWMAQQLLLDNSLRLLPLEKIQVRNELQLEAIAMAKALIDKLQADYLTRPSQALADEMIQKQDFYNRLVDLETKKYQPDKFAKLR